MSVKRPDGSPQVSHPDQAPQPAPTHPITKVAKTTIPHILTGEKSFTARHIGKPIYEHTSSGYLYTVDPKRGIFTVWQEGKRDTLITIQVERTSDRAMPNEDILKQLATTYLDKKPKEQIPLAAKKIFEQVILSSPTVEPVVGEKGDEERAQQDAQDKAFLQDALIETTHIDRQKAVALDAQLEPLDAEAKSVTIKQLDQPSKHYAEIRFNSTHAELESIAANSTNHLKALLIDLNFNSISALLTYESSRPYRLELDWDYQPASYSPPAPIDLTPESTPPPSLLTSAISETTRDTGSDASSDTTIREEPTSPPTTVAPEPTVVPTQQEVLAAASPESAQELTAPLVPNQPATILSEALELQQAENDIMNIHDELLETSEYTAFSPERAKKVVNQEDERSDDQEVAASRPPYIPKRADTWTCTESSEDPLGIFGTMSQNVTSETEDVSITKLRRALAEVKTDMQETINFFDIADKIANLEAGPPFLSYLLEKYYTKESEGYRQILPKIARSQEDDPGTNEELLTEYIQALAQSMVDPKGGELKIRPEKDEGLLYVERRIINNSLNLTAAQIDVGLEEFLTRIESGEDKVTTQLPPVPDATPRATPLRENKPRTDPRIEMLQIDINKVKSEMSRKQEKVITFEALSFAITQTIPAKQLLIYLLNTHYNTEGKQKLMAEVAAQEVDGEVNATLMNQIMEIAESEKREISASLTFTITQIDEGLAHMLEIWETAPLEPSPSKEEMAKVLKQAKQEEEEE